MIDTPTFWKVVICSSTRAAPSRPTVSVIISHAHLFGAFELTLAEIDRYDIAADRRSDMDRRKANSPASVYGDPFAGFHLRAVDDPVIRRHEPAAHRGALEEIHSVGHRDEVDVGPRDCDVTSVAAPVGESRGARVVTYVGISAAAVLADAVALAERDEHALALLEVVDVFAGFLDNAAELVTHHERHRGNQSDPEPIAGPAVPIGAADSFCLGAH